MRDYFFQKILFISLGSFLFTMSIIYLHSLKKPSSIPYSTQELAHASIIRPQPHYRPQVQHYVRVQLEVRQNPDPLGDKIISVTLDGHNIPLRPVDSSGRRGKTQLQLTPGIYLLQWKVKKVRYSWPKFAIYNQEIHLDPQQTWADILIDGHRAYIR